MHRTATLPRKRRFRAPLPKPTVVAPPPARTSPTREEWLEAGYRAVVSLIRGWMVASGVPLQPRPIPAISCGWPSSRSSTAMQEVVFEPPAIYLSPALGQGMPLDLLVAEDATVTVLAHLAHAVAHLEAQEGTHAGVFGLIARGIGLLGPHEHIATDDPLATALLQVAQELGPYPHQAATRPAPKPGQNRQRKYVCCQCGAIIRAAGTSLQALHLCAGHDQPGRFTLVQETSHVPHPTELLQG